MTAFVQDLSKRIGPKSGTNKMLVVDGEPDALPDSLGDHFDYFILRFDLGMKAVNPAYETSREHYPLLYPNFKRDFAFHFAVGLPF